MKSVTWQTKKCPQKCEHPLINNVLREWPVYQIPASGFVFIKLSCLCRSRTYIKRTKISCITVILKGIVRRVGFPPTRYLVLVTIPPLPLICLMLTQLTLRCDPAGTRTLDLLIKSQQLYQLSYEVFYATAGFEPTTSGLTCSKNF